MKMSEILRSIADLIDQGKDTDVPNNGLTPVHIDNKRGAEQAANGGDVDAMKNTDGQSVMTFPLQQKLELLKKSVDVPNEFDELEDLKKKAGLNHTVITLASDDDVLG